MSRFPTGTVTFLFTDIEGSTRLLQALGDRFRSVIERHNHLLRTSIERHGGVVVRTEGDAFFAVFERAQAAVAAATDAQRALHVEPWPGDRPIRVRMGLHTGDGVTGGDDYVGLDVHRAARIAAAGHGGQILVSAATRSLVTGSLPEGGSLVLLGPHRLRDLLQVEDLFQVALPDVPGDFPPLRTRHGDRFPMYRTSFLGREDEREALDSLLQPGRLVTLTGAGGTGKTRLAVECARAASDRFPDGASFTDLCPVSDPGLVPGTIAASLGIQEQAGRSLTEVVREHLEDRSALVVLDNFEQVVEAAPVVAEIAEGATRCAILITSRVPLRISGEQRLPLEGLDEKAVALFIDRARTVDPAFDPSSSEMADIAAICERLDSLPLAIELAASRVPLMPVGDLRQRVAERLAEVGQGPLDAPTRQRSLESLIEWSYDLLPVEQQRVFARLGAFVGGWSPEAVGPVVDPDGTLDAPGALRSLLDHSLVRRPDRGSARMSMLATIRTFAEDRLEVSGEADEVRARHGAFHADLAEAASPHILGPQQAVWKPRLEAERENLLAAMSWSLREDPSIGLRIAAASWRFWQQRGEMSPIRQMLGRLLDTEAGRRRSLLRARALSAFGSLAYYQADMEKVADAYPEAREIYLELGDEAGAAEATIDLSYLALSTNDPDRADTLAREAVARFAALGDAHGQARARVGLAAALLARGDRDAGRAEASRAVRELEGEGDLVVGSYARDLVARVDMQTGELDAALEQYVALVGMAREVGNDFGMAIGMATMATILSVRGDHRRAVLLAGVYEGQRSVLGLSLPQAIHQTRDPRPAAEAVLGHEEVAALWARGQAMSMLEAYDLIEDLGTPV